jgi:hypothetical protein
MSSVLPRMRYFFGSGFTGTSFSVYTWKVNNSKKGIKKTKKDTKELYKNQAPHNWHSTNKKSSNYYTSTSNTLRLAFTFIFIYEHLENIPNFRSHCKFSCWFLRHCCILSGRYWLKLTASITLIQNRWFWLLKTASLDWPPQTETEVMLCCDIYSLLTVYNNWWWPLNILLPTKYTDCNKIIFESSISRVSNSFCLWATLASARPVLPMRHYRQCA